MSATVTVEGVSADQVVRLCASQGWQAKPARRLPEDTMVLGLLILLTFLLLLVVLYVVADYLFGVSDTLFGIIGGAATQASTVHQGANAYRDRSVAFAQNNYAPPQQTAPVLPPSPTYSTPGPPGTP